MSGVWESARLHTAGCRKLKFKGNHLRHAFRPSTAAFPALILSAAALTFLAVFCAQAFDSESAIAASTCPNQAVRVGSSAALPDCRAYEQVSPEEKVASDAISLRPLYPSQASPCAAGQACSLLYMNAGAAFAGAAGNTLPNAYIGLRAESGWSTSPLTPALAQPPAAGAQVAYWPSPDLTAAVLRVPFEQLTPGAPGGVYNLFLHRADGSYALITAIPPPSPPTAGCSSCFQTQDVPIFAGASAGFSHVLFEANDALTPGAPGPGIDNLYETDLSSEAVHLVGVLPDGTIPPEGSNVGGGIDPVTQRAADLEGAISADGSRVIFEATADEGPPDSAQAGKTELYDRIDGSSTIEISAPAPGALPSNCETAQGICDPEPAQFHVASADGALVYFTSSAALTSESNTGSEVRTPGEIEEEEIEEVELHNPGNDLYRYDVDTATLTDLTVDHRPEDPNGAGVLGVLGSSANGELLYFVARGKLAPGAMRGAPNLYKWQGSPQSSGSITYIATLAEPSEGEEEDAEHLRTGTAFPYNSDILDWTNHPTLSQTYITPDGEHLAFMSVQPLSGYDNEDQTTGRADHEVFSYDAETDQLRCVSCDPSGAPPLGSAFIGAQLDERTSTPFHQPRTLSDNGQRLFFSSPDPLTPGTAAGRIKVFEYEDGAIQRISGASDPTDDAFLDASASGDDVFIATRAQLVPIDEDELADVYDARVGGGLPAAPPAIAPCLGESCRGEPAPPPSWPAPSSVARAAGASHHPRSKRGCRRLVPRRARRKCRATKRHRPSHGPSLFGAAADASARIGAKQ